MLTLTENAVEAVRQLTAASGLEPDPGLRISPGQPSDTGRPLEISLTTGPEASDHTVEEGGATVYVEDDVADFLDDKVLDAAVDSNGIRFRIHDVGN